MLFHPNFENRLALYAFLDIKRNSCRCFHCLHWYWDWRGRPLTNTKHANKRDVNLCPTFLCDEYERVQWAEEKPKFVSIFGPNWQKLAKRIQSKADTLTPSVNLNTFIHSFIHRYTDALRSWGAAAATKNDDVNFSLLMVWLCGEAAYSVNSFYSLFVCSCVCSRVFVTGITILFLSVSPNIYMWPSKKWKKCFE